jgi:hypothetical protein
MENVHNGNIEIISFVGKIQKGQPKMDNPEKLAT